jgi:hypothetical protein
MGSRTSPPIAAREARSDSIANATDRSLARSSRAPHDRAPVEIPTLAILVFVLFVAIVVSGAILAHRAAKRFRDAMAAIADANGFDFGETDLPGVAELRAPFAAFARGHSRKAGPTIAGTTTIGGRTQFVALGKFRFDETRGSGKDRRTTTTEFSYVVVALPYPTPKLQIRREGLLDKLAGVFGFDDIDFESAEFSRRFHVTSKDRKFAYDLVTPKMIDFLMTHDVPPIELDVGVVLWTDGATSWTAPQHEQRLRELRAFLELWPQHLVERLEQVERAARGR